MTLIVHHIQVGQSERIPWLCEELGIDYKLVLHQRAPFFAPQSIKDLHETGQAPIIQDGDLTLAESAACAEYIVHRHGNGKLALPPTHKNYADYLYWFHFANSGLQPTVLSSFYLSNFDASHPVVQRQADKLKRVLGMMDKRLSDNTWLAGKEFSLADIMTIFSLTTFRTFWNYDLTGYDGILAYLKRITERDGYKKARAKADPDLELMIDGKPPMLNAAKLRAAGKI